MQRKKEVDLLTFLFVDILTDRASLHIIWSSILQIVGDTLIGTLIKE